MVDQINFQPIEKLDRRGDGMLDLHSMFYTIQGEGPFTGRASVFIRLAGCNLQCPWCDTEYTQNRKYESAVNIGSKAIHLWRSLSEATGPRAKPLIVITGGEPFRQSLAELIAGLVGAGCSVQVESNGVLQPDEATRQVMSYFKDQVFVIISPKTSRVHEFWNFGANAFKYVLQAGEVAEDGLPLKALGHKAHPQVARPDWAKFRGPVYINPMDAKDEAENTENLQAVVQSCLRFGYTAGVQLHKMFEVE